MKTVALLLFLLAFVLAAAGFVGLQERKRNTFDRTIEVSVKAYFVLLEILDSTCWVLFLAAAVATGGGVLSIIFS